MIKQKRDWVKILEEYRKSGHSAKEFCALHGIHLNTFYTKRKQHGRRPLVEIPVIGTAEEAPIVVSRGGFSVSISRGFDRESLRAVLEVIGELR